MNNQNKLVKKLMKRQIDDFFKENYIYEQMKNKLNKSECEQELSESISFTVLRLSKIMFNFEQILSIHPYLKQEILLKIRDEIYNHC